MASKLKQSPYGGTWPGVAAKTTKKTCTTSLECFNAIRRGDLAPEKAHCYVPDRKLTGTCMQLASAKRRIREYNAKIAKIAAAQQQERMNDVNAVKKMRIEANKILKEGVAETVPKHSRGSAKKSSLLKRSSSRLMGSPKMENVPTTEIRVADGIATYAVPAEIQRQIRIVQSCWHGSEENAEMARHEKNMTFFYNMPDDQLGDEAGLGDFVLSLELDEYEDYTHHYNVIGSAVHSLSRWAARGSVTKRTFNERKFFIGVAHALWVEYVKKYEKKEARYETICNLSTQAFSNIIRWIESL